MTIIPKYNNRFLRKKNVHIILICPQDCIRTLSNCVSVDLHQSLVTAELTVQKLNPVHTNYKPFTLSLEDWSTGDTARSLQAR